MTATEQLRREHQAIVLGLLILEKFCQRIGAGQGVNQEHFDQVLEFIRVFADQCHHGKEEQFLFPAMESAGIPKTGGPLGVMLSEHEHGRELIRQLAASWEKYKAGDRAASAALIAAARNYIALLNAHIMKENSVLFPMAEMRLSPDTQRKLAEDFERLEVEQIGAGRHEQFHKTLDLLTKTYLGG